MKKKPRAFWTFSTVWGKSLLRFSFGFIGGIFLGFRRRRKRKSSRKKRAEVGTPFLPTNQRKSTSIFYQNFCEAKIKRIPTGIHKTFAGAKIKLASAKLANKTKVLLHRTAVQWYLPSASGIALWAVVCLCIAQTLLQGRGVRRPCICWCGENLRGRNDTWVVPYKIFSGRNNRRWFQDG